MIVNDPSKTRRETIIVASILLLLQLSLVPNIGIGSGRANLALVFVCYYCMGGESSKAPIAGFCAGLLYDLSSNGPIGLMALILTLIAWGVSNSNQPKPVDDFGGSMAFFVPVACAVGLIYCTILMACGYEPSFLEAIFFHALPGVILDTVSFAILVAILVRVTTPTSRLGGPRHGSSKGGLTMKRGL